MGKYFDLLLERKKIRDKYLQNIDHYLDLIKERAQNLLGQQTKVYLFGSYVTGKFGPRSDVDLLIVTEKEIDQREKSKLMLQILQGFEIFHPFEIHFASQDQFEHWYRKFLQNNYQEI